MTAKQLIDKLQEVEPDAQVWIRPERFKQVDADLHPINNFGVLGDIIHTDGAREGDAILHCPLLFSDETKE